MVTQNHAAGIPATQHAFVFTGPGTFVLDRAKPVSLPGPTQLLLKVGSVSLCFSDTKLLHSFADHPRKAEVVSGVPRSTLEEIPSYVPNDRPTVAGHEVSARVAAVGYEVTAFAVGDRVLVQPDYRSLPTPRSNAAFGYNFEGGLQEYVLVDERTLIDPATGRRYLLAVSEAPSWSAISLIEPWACVERSYAATSRGALEPHGRLLIVVDAGHEAEGVADLVAASAPREIVVFAPRPLPGSELEVGGQIRQILSPVGSLDALEPASFDDIIYFGVAAQRIETLGEFLGKGGILNIVCGGRRIGQPVAIDVGRIHYDGVRLVGTPSSSAADGYAMIPSSGELRPGDAVAIVGAAGPMGFMHTIRAIVSDMAGIRVDAIDIDDDRLERLAVVAGPIARRRGVEVRFVNSRRTPPGRGFSYVGLMVPSAAILAAALDLAGAGARVNVFAGFAAGTRAEVDLDSALARRIFMFGTSGLEDADMRTVLQRLERGDLDPNVSVDAVCGMAGVAAALEAVEARTSGGKIVVYPELHDLALTRLADLAERMPDVGAALDGGHWCRGAEDALLQAMAGRTKGSREEDPTDDR